MISFGSNNDVRAKIFYFNDLHSNIKGAKRLKTAADNFDKMVQNQQVDAFKLCAGDSYIGRTKNNFIGKFLNSMGLDGMVLGNHEFDMGTKQLSEFFNNNLFKSLVSNLDFKKGNNLQDDIDAGRLAQSYIVEKNGHKYGLIGATAADFRDTSSKDTQDDCKDVGFMDVEQSIDAVQKEVDKLKSQGINKIILISHLGIDKDRQLAQKTDGIDVIVGGHSHHFLEGVNPGDNYFASKSGEPVLILQAGLNGEKYGLLDVVFDKNGKLKAADNKLISTKELPESLIIKYFEDITYGRPENFGKLQMDLNRATSEFEEHPLACFVAEAMKRKTGAQIAFHNKGCQKTTLKAGREITNRDIQIALPYINTVGLYKMSEKDIVEVLKASLDKPKDGEDKIGNLQVAGMNYTIGKNNELKEACVLDGDKKIKLDIDDPSDDKFFTVTYGSFFAGGPSRLKMLYAPEKQIQRYEWDDLQATLELIRERSKNGILDIKRDGRIKIEK